MIVATSIICVVAAYVSQRLRLHDVQVEWTALRIEGDPLEQTDWQPFGPYGFGASRVRAFGVGVIV